MQIAPAGQNEQMMVTSTVICLRCIQAEWTCSSTHMNQKLKSSATVILLTPRFNGIMWKSGLESKMGMKK